MAILVGTITILGEECRVKADDRGVFWIEDPDGGDLGHGETLEKAKTIARTMLNKRRVNLAIPFVMEDGRRGVATKRDARSRDVRVTWADGTKGKVSTFKSPLKPDIPEKVLADLQQRQRTIEAEQAEIKKIRAEWSFSLTDAVDEAVKAAAAETEGG